MDSDIIYHYFSDISTAQKEQFRALEGLYNDWNAKINVISRKDIDELYLKHVLHSLGIAKVVSFYPGTKVLDVGTGGGFPGIPLAILFPESHFHLVDSVGKKINVVQNIASHLGLTNISTEKIRAEQVNGRYDFIVSRAVTRMAEFHGWVKGKMIPSAAGKSSLKNGILYLKGGDLTEELSEAKVKFKLFRLSDYFQEDFFETKSVVYIPNH